MNLRSGSRRTTTGRYGSELEVSEMSCGDAHRFNRNGSIHTHKISLTDFEIKLLHEILGHVPNRLDEEILRLREIFVWPRPYGKAVR